MLTIADILMNLENSNDHDNKKKAQFGVVQYVIKSAIF